jgi:leucyl/phenylalanyl-tRNA---protein transferase
MTVYELSDQLVFPSPELAHHSGLLAIGGDLTLARLILAYSNGIFPWFSKGDPIMWWSPDPRMVVFPDRFKPSKSLRRAISSGKFHVRMNTCFTRVMRHCGDVPRKDQDGTWITHEMLDAYAILHEAGFAHSVETFCGEELVGGLYGVCLGNTFFGESMFHLVSDASKVAFAYLIGWCLEHAISVIDAQQNTSHLASLGGVEISRKEFLAIIREG